MLLSTDACGRRSIDYGSVTVLYVRLLGGSLSPSQSPRRRRFVAVAVVAVAVSFDVTTAIHRPSPPPSPPLSPPLPPNRHRRRCHRHPRPATESDMIGPPPPPPHRHSATATHRIAESKPKHRHTPPVAVTRRDVLSSPPPSPHKPTHAISPVRHRHRNQTVEIVIKTIMDACGLKSWGSCEGQDKWYQLVHTCTNQRAYVWVCVCVCWYVTRDEEIQLNVISMWCACRRP